MTLQFYPLRFSFEACDEIFFPPGKTGNILRGAFGVIFRKLACVPHCTDARTCSLRAVCAYPRLFEPVAPDGPSGMNDAPRPFVFRAAHLDGRRIPPRARFHYDMNLFELRDPALAYLVLAFSQFARDGLGPGRGRARLESVDLLDEHGAPAARIFESDTFRLASPPPPLSVPLTGDGTPAARVLIRFLTPTELKDNQQIASRPEFSVLFRRIRDRVSTLRAVYGPGPIDIDFRSAGERARSVRMTRCDVHHVSVTRQSSRTHQTHPIGGFIGEAEYEGELGEFMPYLRAATFTGVGRQTVWGKGHIAVTLPA